ncbi:MAG: hypothetical protein EXR62_11770, partial [Chloroflexi bacterium]|nr:hypothetical protein [Chloroflexota bacterium]
MSISSRFIKYPWFDGKTAFVQPLRTVLRLEGRALAAICLAVITFFLPEFIQSTTFGGGDVSLAYWPFSAAVAQAFQAGDFHFWWTNLFGGLPLYALGSLGMFYPLNWPVFLLVKPLLVFNTILFQRVLLTALFTYALGRRLQLSPLGAAVSGLVFAFSGFSVSHFMHLDIGNSLTWLPALLWCGEGYLQQRGFRRIPWLAGCGISLAMSLLGVHFNIPPVMLVGFGLYVAARLFLPWERPSEGPFPWLQGLIHLFLLTGSTLILGLGLSAVQILPAVELLALSDRAGGITYQRATEYAIAPTTLLTFILPHFFLGPGGEDWTIWGRHETSIFVGILPLLLALLAPWVAANVGAGFGRMSTRFWAALAMVSLILAMANFSPLINLHWLLYQLPGFHEMRSPARFGLLTDLSLALLAGYTLTALNAPLAVATRRYARRLLWIFAIAAGLLIITMVGLRLVADTRPELVKSVLAAYYLSAAWHSVPLPPADRLVDFLRFSLNVFRPATAISLLLLGGSLGLLGLWITYPRRRGWWNAVTVVFMMLDLGYFAFSFNPVVSLQSLAHPGSAYDTLIERARGARIYTWSNTPLQPNQLLAAPVNEMNGYHPMQIHRQAEYAALAELPGNRLADLWGIRYILPPSPPSPQKFFKTVGYTPNQSLGEISNVNSQIDFSLLHRRPATVIRAIVSLQRAVDIPQDTRVGEMRVATQDGRVFTLPLVAGQNVAEWASERSDVVDRVKHRLPSNTGDMVDLGKDENGQEFAASTLSTSTLVMHLFWQEIPVTLPGAEPVQLSHVTFSYYANRGKLVIHGISYVDESEFQGGQLNRFDNIKFQRVDTSSPASQSSLAVPEYSQA